MTLASTPWVDNALNSVWDRIVAAAPSPDWVPLHSTKGKKLVMQELGCGSYGCVMPTSDPAVVIKVTSDMTEAAFVAASMTLGPPAGAWEDAGIVRYYAVYRLPGTHKGRPMFVLWREAATEVGLSWDSTKRDYERWSRVVLYNLLDHYKQFAGVVREAHKKGMLLPENISKFQSAILKIEAIPESDSYFKDVMRQTPVQGRVGTALAALHLIEDTMENTAICDAIGQALAFYRTQGLLLSDVHHQNVGLVPRMQKTWVITDPGHAVPLNPKYETVAIEDLP